MFGGPDGVHPRLNGHLVMAYAFLKALGCDGNIGTITVQGDLNQATGSPGQQIVSCQGGTVTVTEHPLSVLLQRRAGLQGPGDHRGHHHGVSVQPGPQPLHARRARA